LSIEDDLPRSIEAEQAVLGTFIIDKESAELIDSELRGDEFYFPYHQTIFKAMQKLREEEKDIDLLTMTIKLQELGQVDEIGGVSYLSKLTSSVVNAGNIKHYINTVKTRHITRLIMIDAKQRYIEARQCEDPSDIIAGMQMTANDFSDRTVKAQDFRPIRDVVYESYENIEKRYASRSESGVTGIPSGFVELDRMTAGFQKSDLIIVAARPSVGKTAFALNIGQNVGIHTQETVAIFSLEMSATQLVDRMISAEGNVDAGRIRTGFVEGDDWEKVTIALGHLSAANIFIDDTPGINVHEIRAKCRRLKKSHGLGMVIIDYLQLIPGRGKRGENRQQEVSEISRTLKLMARELNVPVIALSQLSRGVEQRQDKRPMMSDLRESGAIEQDADIVAFLYRDDYYDKETEKKNIIEIIIAKQRNGPVGTVELAFLKNFNKFVTLDRKYEPPKRDETEIDKQRKKRRYH
jgi:replicative DNA helicase